MILSLCLVPLAACSEEQGKRDSTQQQSDGYVRKPLKITTQDGRDLFFQVEVANTPESRAKGLMFREELAPDHGMIFLFSDAKPRSFWMRNTFLALDIIFVDDIGRITTIGEGKPLNESPVLSNGAARAAIELNRGTAERLGIQIGDQIHFLGLNQ